MEMLEYPTVAVDSEDVETLTAARRETLVVG